MKLVIIDQRSEFTFLPIESVIERDWFHQRVGSNHTYIIPHYGSIQGPAMLSENKALCVEGDLHFVGSYSPLVTNEAYMWNH
jgi:hypothetical protein